MVSFFLSEGGSQRGRLSLLKGGQKETIGHRHWVKHDLSGGWQSQGRGAQQISGGKRHGCSPQVLFGFG